MIKEFLGSTISLIVSSVRQSFPWLSPTEVVNINNKTLESTYNYKYEDDNWKDKLTKIEIVKDGKTTTKEISSDNIGNFTKYDGYTFDWESGRQLKGIKGNGKNIEFEYNDEGIRTRKITDEEDIYYHVVDDKVTYELIYNNNDNEKIYYTYDGDDRLVSLNFRGQEYYYIRNAENDIISLADGNGKTVVSYTYDSWGKLLGIEGELKDTLGVKNPYRYKGYRYDNETGLYYLKARYYNPELGRFITPDSIGGKTGEILSHNLFSYCGNNPVNAIDEDGNMFEWIKSAWNNMKGKFKKTGDKVRTRKITTQIKKGVRGVNNATKNIFGRGIKTITNAYKKPHKWVNNSWQNIKKAHHRIVRYTPVAIVNPKRYASEERMNEDIGTRMLNDLKDSVVFIVVTLDIALQIWDMYDDMNSLSFAGAGNGISVFPTSKGVKKVAEIGGDALSDSIRKSKNLYKFAKGTGNISSSIGNKALKQINKKWGKKGVEAFEKAANKGIVGAKGQNGIKVLNKEYGDYRIFGYIDEAGKFIFDQFSKGLH